MKRQSASVAVELALRHALLAPLCHLVKLVKFITSRVAVRACLSASPTASFVSDETQTQASVLLVVTCPRDDPSIP